LLIGWALWRWSYSTQNKKGSSSDKAINRGKIRIRVMTGASYVE